MATTMQALKHILKRTPLYDLLGWAQYKRQDIEKKKLTIEAVSEWSAHDQRMLGFYRRFVGPGDLCFDVGANIGVIAKVLLRLGATVVAVEPQDQCVGILRAVYGNNPSFHLVQKALGQVEGQAEMRINDDASNISSLSEEWIQAVKSSGRFAGYAWDQRQVVQMTTLDNLIDEYSVPAFIKIDVEGYEYQVVRGLTQPVGTLSLEFTPEFIEPTFRCIDYLSSLGNIQLNYTIDPGRLVLSEWVSPEQMIEILSRYPQGYEPHGDLYVRFMN